MKSVSWFIVDVKTKGHYLETQAQWFGLKANSSNDHESIPSAFLLLLQLSNVISYFFQKQMWSLCCNVKWNNKFQISIRSIYKYHNQLLFCNQIGIFPTWNPMREYKLSNILHMLTHQFSPKSCVHFLKAVDFSFRAWAIFSELAPFGGDNFFDESTFWDFVFFGLASFDEGNFFGESIHRDCAFLLFCNRKRRKKWRVEALLLSHP